MTSKMVIQRRMEKDHVGLVWTGVVEAEGDIAVQLREEGWGVAEPASFPRDSGESTLHHRC